MREVSTGSRSITVEFGIIHARSICTDQCLSLRRGRYDLMEGQMIMLAGCRQHGADGITASSSNEALR